MKKKKRNVNLDILRVVKAQNRAQEIRTFGRSVLRRGVQGSKKAYDRKKAFARRLFGRAGDE